MRIPNSLGPQSSLLAIKIKFLAITTPLPRGWVALAAIAGISMHAFAAPLGPILKSDSFKNYVARFNADDEELYQGTISNSDSWAFLSANIPLLECPDPDLERTYYFRWWSLRKHIKQTPDGHVITEFLPRMAWGGKHNEINCPAGHHFYESRWLHDAHILDDYGRYWFRKGGSPRKYSFWAADAVYAQYLVTGNKAPAVDLLPDLVKNFEGWERSNRDPNRLFWQKDVLDGMEVSVAGDGYRATINSYMFGDANAIAAIADLAGQPELATRFRNEAVEIKQLVQQQLWDAAAKFFKVAPRLDAIPPKSAGILEWQVNGSAAITRSALPSASHCGEGDTVSALNDGRVPNSSQDREIPRLTFGDHQGTREWVQYDFPESIEAQSVQVFWCSDDDGVRLPKTWRLLYRAQGEWRPVAHLERYRADADRFTRLRFESVRTDGLRIELQCQGVSTPSPAGRLPLAEVRELHGYTPWYFNLPDAEFAAAWKQIMDPQGFFAPYGPTTAEQRHPEFMLDDEGHPCQWNGPSWPFSTAVTLTALANLLNGPAQNFVTQTDYLTLLRNYARSQQLRRDDGQVVSWIDENLNPFTGEWLVRTKLIKRKAKPVERGQDYNHSTFCDLIISGLIGLRPRADDLVEVNPLVPPGTWEYFCLDHIPYHGHTLTVLWDHDGSKYGRGKGMRLFANGREIAAQEQLGRLTAPLPERATTPPKAPVPP